MIVNITKARGYLLTAASIVAVVVLTIYYFNSNLVNIDEVASSDNHCDKSHSANSCEITEFSSLNNTREMSVDTQHDSNNKLNIKPKAKSKSTDAQLAFLDPDDYWQSEDSLSKHIGEHIDPDSDYYINAASQETVHIGEFIDPDKYIFNNQNQSGRILGNYIDPDEYVYSLNITSGRKLNKANNEYIDPDKYISDQNNK